MGTTTLIAIFAIVLVAIGLTFPDSSLGLEIQPVKSGQKYTVASAQVITELGPEEPKEIT